VKPLHIFYAVIISFSWGINSPLIKMALNSMPPLAFCTLRSLLLGLLVIFFPKPNLPPHIIGIFTLLHGLKVTLLYYSLSMGLDAGISTVLLQTQSLFTVLIAVLFLKENITTTSAMGLILSFVGVCVIGADLHAQGSAIAMGIVLLSAFCATLSFLVMRDHKNVNYLSFVGYFNLWSIIPFFLCSYYVDGASLWANILPCLTPTFLSILALSALTVVSAYVFMVFLFSIYPTSVVAPYFLLVPIFGLSGGYLCLSEWCPLQSFLGSVVVILGLILNQYGVHLNARSKRLRS